MYVTLTIIMWVHCVSHERRMMVFDIRGATWICRDQLHAMCNVWYILTLSKGMYCCCWSGLAGRTAVALDTQGDINVNHDLTVECQNDTTINAWNRIKNGQNFDRFVVRDPTPSSIRLQITSMTEQYLNWMMMYRVRCSLGRLPGWSYLACTAHHR